MYQHCDESSLFFFATLLHTHSMHLRNHSCFIASLCIGMVILYVSSASYQGLPMIFNVSREKSGRFACFSTFHAKNRDFSLKNMGRPGYEAIMYPVYPHRPYSEEVGHNFRGMCI